MPPGPPRRRPGQRRSCPSRPTSSRRPARCAPFRCRVSGHRRYSRSRPPIRIYRTWWSIAPSRASSRTSPFTLPWRNRLHSWRLGAEQLLRGLCRLPDPRDDPVGLVFGDRNEVVHGVASLGRVEQRRELPLQVTREHFINLPAVALNAAEHPNRPIRGAVLVDDRVVGDVVAHRFLSGKSWISSVPRGVASSTFTRRWNSSSSSRSTAVVSFSGRRSRS